MILAKTNESKLGRCNILYIIYLFLDKHLIKYVLYSSPTQRILHTDIKGKAQRGYLPNITQIVIDLKL